MTVRILVFDTDYSTITDMARLHDQNIVGFKDCLFLPLVKLFSYEKNFIVVNFPIFNVCPL